MATELDEGLLGAAARVLRRLQLATTFVKFLIVGGIGYLINQLTLFLLYDSPVVGFLPAKIRS